MVKDYQNKTFYHFRCGCETTEPYRYHNHLICSDHKTKLEYVVKHCARCGREMILQPMASKTMYCRAPVETIDRRGDKRIVKGCSQTLLIEKNYRDFKRRQRPTKKRQPRHYKAKHYDISMILGTYHVRWDIPKTPTLDKLIEAQSIQATDKISQDKAIAPR